MGGVRLGAGVGERAGAGARRPVPSARGTRGAARNNGRISTRLAKRLACIGPPGLVLIFGGYGSRFPGNSPHQCTLGGALPFWGGARPPPGPFPAPSENGTPGETDPG